MSDLSVKLGVDSKRLRIIIKHNQRFPLKAWCVA